MSMPKVPKRIWFWGSHSTWNEWRIFRGSAENCNPTVCFYTPLGAMIIMIGRRWRTEMCDDCIAEMDAP